MKKKTVSIQRYKLLIFNSYGTRVCRRKKKISSLSSQTVHIVMHIRYPTIILNTLNIFPVTSIIPLKLVHPKILRSALNHHSFPLFTEGNHHPWGWYNLKIQNQFLFPFFFFFSSQTRSVPRTKHLVPDPRARWKTVDGRGKKRLVETRATRREGRKVGEVRKWKLTLTDARASGG